MDDDKCVFESFVEWKGREIRLIKGGNKAECVFGVYELGGERIGKHCGIMEYGV